MVETHALVVRSAPLRRRGVTLVELLVTLVVASVVITGLGSLFMGAAMDYERAARIREERYSRQLLEAELVWRTKVVPPEFLPVPLQLPALGSAPFGGYQIGWDWGDSRGAQVRKVLAFDYLRNDMRLLAPPTPATFVDLGISGIGCTARIPGGIQIRTAAIFQYFSSVYVLERDISSSADSFRTMANLSTLQGFLKGILDNPANALPVGVVAPTPLAIGIENLDFAAVGGIPSGPCDSIQLRDSIAARKITWTYTQHY